MNVRRKLAAIAIAGGVFTGGIALAAPANATAIEIGCPTKGLEILSGDGNKCFGYRDDGEHLTSIVSIAHSWGLMSAVNKGYVNNAAGWKIMDFYPWPNTTQMPNCGSCADWTVGSIYFSY